MPDIVLDPKVTDDLNDRASLFGAFQVSGTIVSVLHITDMLRTHRSSVVRCSSGYRGGNRGTEFKLIAQRSHSYKMVAQDFSPRLSFVTLPPALGDSRRKAQR